MRKKVSVGIMFLVVFIVLIVGLYFKNMTNANADAYVQYERYGDTWWSLNLDESDSYNLVEIEFQMHNVNNCGFKTEDSSWKVIDEQILDPEFIIINDEEGNIMHREMLYYKEKFYLLRVKDSVEDVRKTIFEITCESNESITGQKEYGVSPGKFPQISKVNTNEYDYELLSKKDGNAIASVKKGEEFLYELNITGNNYYNDKKVVVTDIIPKGLEIIDSNGATVNGQTLTWDLGIPKKGEYSKKINIKVKAKEAGKYTNTATINIGTGEQKVENKINVYYSDIALTVNKSVNEATVGDVITYDLVLSNTGNITSENVTVNLKLDEDLTLLNSNTQMTESNGQYYFSLGKLAAGANQTITFRVQLNRDASERDILSTVSVTEEGKVPIVNKISTKSLKPNLVLSTTSDKSAIRKNELLKIVVKVKNTGNGTVKNLDLTYAIDDNLEIESIEGNTNIASLSKNEEASIIFNLKSQRNANMKKTNNIFTITSDNTSSINKNISIDISDSNLEITKIISKNNQIGNNVIKPNEEFSYVIKVKNTGKLKAENVIYQEIINSNINFINGIASKNNVNINGTMNENGMTFNLDTIEPNEEYSIVITLKLKSDANINDVIDILGILSENGKDDKRIQNSIIVSDSDLYIYVTKSVEEISKNDEITLTYNIVNNSDLDTENIKIQTYLPDGLEYVSSSFSNNELTTENNVINVNISKVQKNNTVQYSLTLKASNNIRNNEVLNVGNTLTAGDKTFEYATSIETIDSDLRIEVKSNLKEVKINDEIILSINLSNKGRKKSSNIILTYKIDSNLKIVDADGGQINDNVITWNFDTLDANSTREINVKVKVLEKSNTYANILSLAEEGKDSIEENPSFTYKDEINNPETGTFLNVLSLIVFLIIGLMIILKSKRKNIINKI